MALIIVPMIMLYRMMFFGEIVGENDQLQRYPINEWRDTYNQTHKDFPQWYPNLFSGMPSYGGYIYTPADPTKGVIDSLFFNKGLKVWFYLSLAGIGMFILLRFFGVSHFASALGAILSGLTPYSFGLINAGHFNKIYAIAFIPWVLWSAFALSKRVSLKTVLTLSLFTSLQLWVNHPQIVYYTWMVIGFYWVWNIGTAIVNKSDSYSKNFVHLGGIIAGLAIALVMVADPYIDILEFQQYSNRGAKSVLDQTGETESGTNWNYATQWSFHPKETISFVYPYFFGLQNYSTRDIKSAAYWGYMPFTQSTHYLGLVAILFAILGALLKKPDGSEWFFWIVSILALVTGFGSYFPILFKPFYSILPFFSKFRIPSMIYVLLAISLPILAAKGMDTFLEKIDDKETIKKLFIVTGSIIGISLFLILIGDGFIDFTSPKDGRYNAGILSQLVSARMELFHRGLLLALGVSMAIGGIGWGLSQKKISVSVFWVFLTAIIVVDLWIINMEFLNLKPAKNMESHFKTNSVVDVMKNDNDHFRIFPADEIGSNRYSFWNLESISGYRPIKLRNYQDFMDGTKSLSGKSQIPFIARPKLLNMLNVKYIVTSKQINNPTFVPVEGIKGLYQNTNVLPKAWFVQKVKSVSTQRESLMETLLNGFNPQSEAIVVDYNGTISPDADPGSVQVISREENKIELQSESNANGLMVLSEIYYKPGWKAFVDGIETPIYQTNHILRSIDVPSGKHSIIFEYDDSRWGITRMISRILFLGVIVILLFLIRKDLRRIISTS